MKKRLISILMFVGTIVFISCKKDSNPIPVPPNPVTPVVPANKPPIAKAGPDDTVYYDLQTCKIDAVNVDGSSSADPDGRIISYLWSGHGVISNPDSPRATIRPLSTGKHQFVLTLYDNKYAISRDTVNIFVESLMNRPTVGAQLIPFANLSQARDGISVGRVGNKILFAGGMWSLGESSRVDIYDMSTQQWTTAELSLARQGLTVVSSGNKLFFAGGWSGDWWDVPEMYKTVDIYDAETNSWAIKQLSEGRFGIGAASVGNKVFFAGGTMSPAYPGTSKVDIYDTQTNSWSTSALSVARTQLSAETVGDKIYFAGGAFGSYYVPVKTIDVYDNSTGLWSTSSMHEAKASMKSFSLGNKVIWTGGYSIMLPIGNYNSGFVEIKDVSTQTSSLSCLCEPQAWADNDRKAVIRNNQIVFFPANGSQNKFDIYDITSNSWKIGVLNKGLWGASLISVGNEIYVAGGVIDGAYTNMVWKLEF